MRFSNWPSRDPLGEFGHIFGVGPLALKLIDRSDWVAEDGRGWDWGI